jgi:hypothetical protein
LIHSITTPWISQILSTANRVFVASGELQKLCAHNLQVPYQIVLFGDSLLYASSDGANSLKIHRVIQIAFCTLIDLTDSDRSFFFSSLIGFYSVEFNRKMSQKFNFHFDW